MPMTPWETFSDGHEATPAACTCDLAEHEHREGMRGGCDGTERGPEVGTRQSHWCLAILVKVIFSALEGSFPGAETGFPCPGAEQRLWLSGLVTTSPTRAGQAAPA